MVGRIYNWIMQHASVKIEGYGPRVQTKFVRLFLWILHNNMTAMNLRL